MSLRPPRAAAPEIMVAQCVVVVLEDQQAVAAFAALPPWELGDHRNIDRVALGNRGQGLASCSALDGFLALII